MSWKRSFGVGARMSSGADVTMDTLLLSRMATPIGEMLLISDEESRLLVLDWTDHEDRMERLLIRRHREPVRLAQGSPPSGIREPLEAYFDGDLRALERIAIRTHGTLFQVRVWEALRGIGPGETRTYGQVAVEIGQPKALRAVGLANGSNPIGLVVPCHRVIGADGSLTGYGGGLERKRWLLKHERALGFCDSNPPLLFALYAP